MSVVAIDNITTEIIRATERVVNTLPSPASRVDALEILKQVALPSSKSEEYKFTPVTRVLEKQFDLTKENGTSTLDPQSFVIKGLNANILIFINGIYQADASTIISKEIAIETLADAISNSNATAIRYFNSITKNTKDPFAAWNGAVWQNGVFIHVPKNINVDVPVVLYHIHDAKQQVISHARNLIVVEQSASIKVIEKYDSQGKEVHFSTSVTEAFVGENADLSMYQIQNDAGARHQVNLVEIQQEGNSRAHCFTFTLDGKLVRNNLHLTLDGEGIESNMYGLYLLHNDTLADNHTVADHRKPNSISNELYKGIMDDKSKGVFNGKIYVRPDAQKTNAFQANRNIVLSDTATVNTKPQLEIWADDVKCSHGCTTGQLDEEAIFYLQARGIDKKSAQAMMLYAFAGEVIDNINDPVIKEFIDVIVGERLQKNF
jgi:Fe-S cluster assembly protein SufD